jgi:hypothetical protein
MKRMMTAFLAAAAVAALGFAVEYRISAAPVPVGSKISVQCNADGTASLTLEPKK